MVLALTVLIAQVTLERAPDVAALQATPDLGQSRTDTPQQTGANLPAGMPIDPELAIAWEQNGCHLNPGNPSCLTIGLAADCAADGDHPACATDSDGDGCIDIAEVRTGFDAFAAEDCIAGAAGEPVINCLFLFETFACRGSPAASDGSSRCAGAARMPQGALPYRPGDCAAMPATPVSDCPPNSRDPTCDGFAPALYPPFGEQRGAIPAATPAAVYSTDSATR